MSWRVWRGGERRAIEIVGRVMTEGVCGECEQRGAQWTMRVRLSPWSQCGCAPTLEPLEILHEGDVDALLDWQRAWPPGLEVRARVRPGPVPMTARLVARL
jgi:hypothetical protein